MTTSSRIARSLTRLARAERTAAERCREAIGGVTAVDAHSVRVLEDCARSHERRQALLSDELIRRGAVPPARLGLSGALATLSQHLVGLASDRAALSLLRFSERRHSRRYRRQLRSLDASARLLAQTQLLPEQERTIADLVALGPRGRVVSIGRGR